MRAIIISFVLFITHAGLAAAQTEDEIKNDVLAALSTPLPITVIGPLSARDVQVVKEGDGFRATLLDPMLMGIVPLTKLSFKMVPAGDKLYRITDFQLPKTLDLFNAVKLTVGSTEFDGVWSTQTRSYQTLGFKLNNLSVVPKSGAGASKVTLGSLALNVAKQGEAGATASKFIIQGHDIVSQGFPPYNVKVADLNAELNANGAEPVDLYAVISRFVVLTAMQPNADAALQFAESLRAKNYDTATLNLTLKGVDVKGAEQGSNDRLSIADVTGAVALAQVTPEEWGTVSVKFNGNKINDKGILGVQEVNIDTGVLALEGSGIPIGASLNAIGKMQAMSRGEDVAFKVSELLDGLLNMGAVKLKSSATGIAYVPYVKTDPVVRIASYSVETGTEGFRDNKGKLSLTAALEGMDLKISNFKNALEEKAYQLFNPKLVHYDFTISDLNEPLLRKLIGDIVIKSSDDYAALAVPAITYVLAMKPMFETKDARFQSADVDVTATSSLRFYPAWVMEALPYEGKSTIKIAGLDKLSALLDEFIATPSDQGGVSGSDKSGIIVGQSLISTFKALAVADGGAQTWNITYPKAGDGLMMVNDTELRFPNFTAYMAPLWAMSGADLFRAPTPAQDENTAVEAPVAPAEEAPVAPAEEAPPVVNPDPPAVQQ
jgi:hypothetical protein